MSSNKGEMLHKSYERGMKVLRYLGGVKSEQGTENSPSFMKRRKSYRSERGDNIGQREIQV